MKNRLLVAVLLSTLTLSALTGCNKKSEAEMPDLDLVTETAEDAKKESATAKETKKEEPKEKVFEVKPGVYSRDYEEEYADGMETFTNYIYFAEDGTGFLIFQDDVPITWNKDSVKDESGNTYKIKMTDEKTLEIDIDGNISEYTYLADSLPSDVVNHMTHLLDGTMRITDIEAADSFYSLISSDTISFYSTTSDADYEAEGTDLADMSANYIELSDKKLPLLFVRTPNAPQEIGIEHVLQYLDGKIYNIIGMDKIDAVYEEAAVIVASGSNEYGLVTYTYKPDSNGELFAFALKETLDGETTYLLCDEEGNYTSVTEEELNAGIEEAIGAEEPITQLEWKSLDEAVY